MNDFTNIKLSDWKALQEIEDLTILYHLGDFSDYETLIKIQKVLNKYGFNDALLEGAKALEKCKKAADDLKDK